MTTPNKREIEVKARELHAQDQHQNGCSELPSINPTYEELVEDGLVFQAQQALMRNDSSYRDYIEREYNEVIGKKKNENEQMKIQPLEFDVSEAMASGIFVSGVSGSGKTNLCFHFAERLMQKGIIVYILDPSQAWRNSSISETITIPQVNKPTQINWKAESTIFDISLLYVKNQRKFTEAFCREIFNKAVHGFKPKVFIMFEDAQIYLPNHVLRSNAAQEVLRLITCGRNYNIRFGLITQFASMVDKTCVKMCKQRYFGFTNERNDIAYLKAFLGDRTSELETLNVGEFLFDRGTTTKRISVSLFNKAAKQDSCLTYQHTSLGDY